MNPGSVAQTAAQTVHGGIAPNLPNHFSGWERYAATLSTFDTFCYDASSIQSRLNVLAPELFSSKVTEVHIIDARTSSKFKAESIALGSAANVERFIEACRPDLRIISLVRKDSVSLLRISQETLLKILHFHQIGLCFLDLLFSFRRQEEELSEKGASLWRSHQLSPTAYELCYQLKYVEQKGSSPNTMWAERQIGVYHRFEAITANSDIMIVIRGAETRLTDTFKQGAYDLQSKTNPLLLHVLLIASYIDNWRWYLDSHAKECMDRENRILTAPSKLQHPTITFGGLQELRDIESQLVSAHSMLGATSTLLSTLETCGRNLLNHGRDPKCAVTFTEDLALSALAILQLKCGGYTESVSVIKRRIEKLINLLSDGLDQRSQETAAKISHSAYTLTLKSVHDSAIVRVVTIITLIYLPLQGVASFFGMNLASVSDQTNRIRFTQDWWLFLAVAGPLTLLTIGALTLAMMQEDKNKKHNASFEP